MQSQLNVLPDTGFMRLSQILGDKDKGIPPIIPISRSTWWAGVKSGRFPKPVKFSARITCWRIEDIKALIEIGKDNNDRTLKEVT